jgi:hypothetical protein
VTDEPIRQDTPDGPSPSSLDAAEELALDLTSEAIRLAARAADGAWTELGAVPLAAGDLRAALDGLRRRAEAHGTMPVTLWLPPAQVLVRRYVLKRGDRTAEALRRLAEDTGHRAETLTVALSPAEDGGLVTVLGASRQTVAEAVDYARRWGFRPDRVSTRVEAERFDAAGPVFDIVEPARAAGSGARSALVAAAAAIAVGLAGWASYGLFTASDPVPSVASAPAATVHRGERAVLADAPMARRARQEATTSEAKQAGPVDPPGSRSAQAGEAVPPPAGGTASPPEPAAATPDAPPPPARGSSMPEHRRTADRPQSTAPPEGAEIGALLAGIGRIRVEEASPEPSGNEAPPQEDLAASDVAPVVAPGRPMPRPGRPETETETAAGQDPGTEDGFIEAEGSDLPPPAAAMSDSRLAAAQAPPPPPRPQRPRRSAPAAVPPTRAAAPPVESAAAQGTLALGATSLIGVIDANSGREALLRTPSGDYLKVARGDEVAGWRVSAIGHDAMRLTRGGESRTLLLVTR